eukprot:972918-Lingulodinium_polyedra.AAC.1
MHVQRLHETAWPFKKICSANCHSCDGGPSTSSQQTTDVATHFASQALERQVRTLRPACCQPAPRHPKHQWASKDWLASRTRLTNLVGLYMGQGGWGFKNALRASQPNHHHNITTCASDTSAEQGHGFGARHVRPSRSGRCARR